MTQLTTRQQVWLSAWTTVVDDKLPIEWSFYIQFKDVIAYYRQCL